MTRRFDSLVLLMVMAAVWSSSASGCAALGSGCDTSNDKHQPVVYEQGSVEDDEYMSSPWDGPLLPFPSGQRYDLKHHLGCVPRQVACWVAFSSSGVGESSLAPASGNLCLLQAIDDELIEIKNDTCSDMYVLVTASCTAHNASTSIDTRPPAGNTERGSAR